MANSLKYKFGWMKIFFSPFKSPIPIFYIGKIAVGTPYMFPRVWRKKSKDDRYMTAYPRKFGFDFVPLGWKWKYDSVRCEWNPVWSFVIWKLQVAVVWGGLDFQEWESYLTYDKMTNKNFNTLDRLKECRDLEPNIWTSGGVTTDYFIASLKKEMEEKVYKITLSEGQLRLLSEVTEKVVRNIVGQLEYGIKEDLVGAMKRHGTYSEDSVFLLNSLLRTVKSICWKLEEYAGYGVGYNEKSDTLWDIHEVIRHQLWKDDENRLEHTVSSNTPSHWNKGVPLIEIDKITVNHK